MPEKYTLLEDLDDYESDVPLIDDFDEDRVTSTKRKRSFKKHLIEALVLAIGIYLVLRYTHKVELPVISSAPTYVQQTMIIIAIFFAFRYFT